MLEWLLVACVGLCMGSLIAMMSFRLPQGENLFLPRSHCMHCRTPLKIYHLCPVVSFVCLRGKCAFCKESISFLYPLIELLVLCIALALFYRWGIIIDTLYLFVIFSLLVSASVIDLKYQAVSMLLLLVTLLIAYVYLFHTQFYFMIALLDSLALVGTVSLLAIFLESFSGRKSLGEGDIVVVAISSSILGTQYGFIALFIASGMALWGLVAGNKKRIAFIPYLSIATLMVLFWM